MPITPLLAALQLTIREIAYISCALKKEGIKSLRATNPRGAPGLEDFAKRIS